MARILGGGLFGEMRGKLGSIVFARNRGGAYSRSYAKPIDPKTIAQLSARNAFGNASSSYHALDPSTKSLWQSFANNVFNPKSGTQGVPSGFNAFVALLTQINNLNVGTTSVEIDGTPKTATFRPFEFSGTPPTFSLEANIATAGGGSIPYSFDNISNFGISYNLDSLDVEVDFNLNVSGIIGPGGQISNFRDAKGNYFGFSIFMSNPVKQPGMFIQNPYLIKLGDVESPILTTPSGVTSTITLKFENTLVAGNYSALPQDDDWVQLSIFAVSEGGMLLRIGSEFTQL